MANRSFRRLDQQQKSSAIHWCFISEEVYSYSRSVLALKNKTVAKGLAIGFFAVGVLLMILGINAGENATIMKKGVQICLECIGIG